MTSNTATPLDLGQSVAGEEDPGASVDMAGVPPGRSGQSAPLPAGQPSGARQSMSPGDQAPVGTPGTGEDVCPRCGGTGVLAGRVCPECDGMGKVNVAVGGA